MKILAIDPGIANTGWANDLKECGTFVTNPSKKLAARIAKTVINLRKLGYPEVIVCEDTFGSLMKPTTLLMGGIMAFFPETQFLLIPPGKWVQEHFGRDKAGTYKKCAVDAAKAAGYIFDTQHAADAASLLLWYKKHGQQKYTKSKAKKGKKK